MDLFWHQTGKDIMSASFQQDVAEGLSSHPKRLPSKYFYDQAGDEIFQAIMQMPEYYLTKSEFEILSFSAEDMLQAVAPEQGVLDIVELGVGDGTKTKLLLLAAQRAKMPVRYVPIDLSQNILDVVTKKMSHAFPEIPIEPICGDYFSVLKDLQKDTERHRLALFLGNNIGNLTLAERALFLSGFREALTPKDYALIGFDLKKNPKVIAEAYADPHGLTKAFNMNVLKRINREFGANFQLQDFDFYSDYCPKTGAVNSYLVSLRKQKVYFPEMGQEYAFATGEVLHTEVSYKYDLEQIHEMARQYGFEPVKDFLDCKHYFADSLFSVLG